MLRYNNYDLESIKDAIKVLKELDVDEVTDEEVWEESRASEEIPCFTNILIEKTFSKLKEVLEEKYSDVENFEATYYVNGRVSSFTVLIDGNIVQEQGDYILSLKNIDRCILYSSYPNLDYEIDEAEDVDVIFEEYSDTNITYKKKIFTLVHSGKDEITWQNEKHAMQILVQRKEIAGLPRGIYVSEDACVSNEIDFVE